MVKPNTPTKYVGTDVNLVTNVIRNREPTLADYIQPETGRYYPIWCTWQVGKNPTTGVEGELWVLTKIVANQGYWVKMTSGGGTGPIIGITVPAGTSPVYPDGAGLVNFTSTGGTIAITGSTVDTINFDLVGGGAAVDSVVGDDGVPVFPDGFGQLFLDTLLVANNTYPTPIYTLNTAPHTQTIGYSLSTANATTNNTSYAGLSYFDDSIFTVNNSGYVSMGGGSHPALQSITGDDTVIVYADATGNIDLTTSIVANSTNATPIFTTSSGASNETIELQLSTTSATTNDENLAGICYFDDSQFTVNADGYVQFAGGVSPTPPVQVGATGLGIKYSASTFSICYYDGTNLSVSNVGYVGIPSTLAPGTIKQFAVTANSSFIDATGASQVAGAVFGMYPSQNWLEDMPFYIYALMDVTETNQVFAIARIPNGETSPVAIQIGKLGTGNVNTQMLILDSTVTTADYELSACVCIGSFRVTKTGGVSNDWTVTALDFRDGINLFNDTRGFSVPLGCFQASAGTHWWANGGTAPVYATNYYKYYIKKEGLVSLYYSADTNTTPGAGAVTAGISIPYNNVEGLHPWGYLGTGHQETFAGASCDIINWQPDSTGNFSSLFYTNPTTSRRYINSDIRGDIRLGCTYQIANFIQGD